MASLRVEVIACALIPGTRTGWERWGNRVGRF
eukprot:SAG25_NODE_531_length_7152_cov_5.755707_4_plen_32_part_00